MKIFATVAVVQALLLVTARSIAAEESKLVACSYFGPPTVINGGLAIKDIDASICSHLLVDSTTLTDIVREKEDSSEGKPTSFEALKAANPDLKVILQIPYWYFVWINYMSGSPGKSSMTQNAMIFLREMGLDGFDFILEVRDPRDEHTESMDDMVDLFCEMKTEFDENGFIITTTSKLGHLERRVQEKYNYTKLARCCDHVKIFGVSLSSNATERLSSLRRIKSSVDLYIERGFEPNKILISVPTYGILQPKAKDQDTGEFEEIIDYNAIDLGISLQSDVMLATNFHNKVGGLIFHKHLMRKMKNSTLGWTIHRDEETKEPFAVTESGLRVSYEDRTSMEAKASYVLEKGLGGIEIFSINSEDNVGTEGEGRFPLTSAVYNAFRGLQTGDNTSSITPEIEHTETD